MRDSRRSILRGAKGLGRGADPEAAPVALGAGVTGDAATGGGIPGGGEADPTGRSDSDLSQHDLTPPVRSQHDTAEDPTEPVGSDGPTGPGGALAVPDDLVHLGFLDHYRLLEDARRRAVGRAEEQLKSLPALLETQDIAMTVGGGARPEDGDGGERDPGRSSDGPGGVAAEPGRRPPAQPRRTSRAGPSRSGAPRREPSTPAGPARPRRRTGPARSAAQVDSQPAPGPTPDRARRRPLVQNPRAQLRRGERQPMRRDRREEIVERLRSGPASANELAEEFGISREGVLRWLRLLERDGRIAATAAARTSRTNRWVIAGAAGTPARE